MVKYGKISPRLRLRKRVLVSIGSNEHHPGSSSQSTVVGGKGIVSGKEEIKCLFFKVKLLDTMSI